jgi:hypothetical protein
VSPHCNAHSLAQPIAPQHPPSHCCHSTSLPPADVQLELNPDSAAKEVLYDEETKTVRIPLAAVTDGQRRTKMVMFTCNKCGGSCVCGGAPRAEGHDGKGMLGRVVRKSTAGLCVEGVGAQRAGGGGGGRGCCPGRKCFWVWTRGGLEGEGEQQEWLQREIGRCNKCGG